MNRSKNAMKLINATKGRFFTVTFITKAGNARTLLGRTGVRQNLTGQGLAYNPEDRGLIVVYDVQAKGYRMVNTNTVTALSCGEIQIEMEGNS